MWILIILAVHVNDPSDIPGKVNLEFKTLEECENTRKSVDWWIKFKSYKVETLCQKL
mgnify:CR=1 FL=1